MTVEHLPTRAEAEEAERVAIFVEEPVHNVTHAKIARKRSKVSEETGDAIYHAVLTLMSSSGTPSPWAYQDIIAAIKEGVQDAFAEHLETHGMAQP